jgi:hypothetical protein
MKTLHSYRANPIGVTNVEELTLVFDQSLPNNAPQIDFLDTWKELYAAEAVQLVDAMRRTLPGGLIDALLIELLRLKASVFKVTL